MDKVKHNVVDNLTTQWNELMALLPNLIGALVILLFGMIVALIIKKISVSLLRKMGLDKMSIKVGVSDVMEDAGLAKRPSTLAGKIVFWLVLFVFMVPAANTLGLNELVHLFKNFIQFLPKVIIALVILILGIRFAQFLRRSIMEKPATINQRSAKTLGNLVYGIMVTVIVLIALEQLDIETELLHSIIILFVGGVMLALSISVGLGTKEVAHNLLAGIYMRETFKPDHRIEIEEEGIVGTIKEVSTLNTKISLSESESVSIPNTKLYTAIVKQQHELK